MSKTQKIIFILIISLAAFLRLYGLNWDQGQHLHPDERFLTMVADDIKLPTSIPQYFNPSISPLNPANAGHGFFVYGTFPLFLVKILAVLVGMDNYGGITLLGRIVSALFDIGTTTFVYLIAKELFLKFQTSSAKLQINSKSQIPNYKRFGNWSLFDNWNLGFGILPTLASFFYAVSVLPIQLSHFFAVDTFLTFFITLSFYLLLRFIKHISAKPKLRVTSYELRVTAALGAAFGLALSSKISAILFLPIIILGFIFAKLSTHMRTKLSKVFLFILIFILSAYTALRAANPYAFSTGNFLNPTISPQFVQNLKTLKSFDKAQTNFPPALQWIKTKPIIFPLRNMLYYGLGLPLGLLAIGGVIYALWLKLTWLHSYIVSWLNEKSHPAIHQPSGHYNHLTISLIVLWTLSLFLFQSIQFAKPLRYFLPIYPFLAIFAGLFAIKLLTISKKLFNKSKIYLLPVTCCLLLVILWPLSFISIYSRPHSRVAASRWIYENIPAGSTLTCEHWDDCLPLPLPGIKSRALNNKKARLLNPADYTILTLPFYDTDTPEKWASIKGKLEQADYLILSSNRLYGSITSVPERYPQTNKFYQQLFTSANNNSWVRKAEFTSRPTLPIPFLNICLTLPLQSYGKIAKQSRAFPGCNGITIIDDYADESFTVYDHPKVIIFKKNSASAQSYLP